MDQSMTLDSAKTIEKEKQIKKQRKLMIISIICVMTMTFVIWYVAITGMFFGEKVLDVEVSEAGVKIGGKHIEYINGINNITNIVSCDRRFLISLNARFVPVKILGSIKFLKYDDSVGNIISNKGSQCFIKVLT